MAITESFFSQIESAYADELLTNGYVIREVNDRAALDEMRKKIVETAVGLIEAVLPRDDHSFLDNIHQVVSVEQLNEFRLGIYRAMNSHSWLRPTYFQLGRPIIESLVGNELSMQNRINFSIQMPSDRTSLLDIHADVFGGETPFQVVQWLPLVDVHRTKSMFILPRPKSDKVLANLVEFKEGGMQALFDSVKKDLIWLDIPYGKVLIFTPNILHGNVLNEEKHTRWSLNCRFTGLLTPYGSLEKSLGSFYLPITPRPVTWIGATYKQPTGFQE
jgi:sporadic carbohydrate cluster 2OG-Fe(II) oxygenase